MNTRNVHSILIEENGVLHIGRRRGGKVKMVNQQCINYNRPCNDHCPAFGDPYPSNDRLSMFVPICDATLECPTSLFTDERKKDDKD